MRLVGCDLHASQQSIAMLDRDTGEICAFLATWRFEVRGRWLRLSGSTRCVPRRAFCDLSASAHRTSPQALEQVGVLSTSRHSTYAGTAICRMSRRHGAAGGRSGIPKLDRGRDDCNGGRTWSAYFEFTRINITPTILPKKIEDLREARGSRVDCGFERPAIGTFGPLTTPRRSTRCAWDWVKRIAMLSRF